MRGAYEIGSDEDSKTTFVDQRFTPGELELEGQRWRSLGYYTAGSESNELVVALSTEGADGLVIADAVMLVDHWDFSDSTPDGSFTELQLGEDDGVFTLETKHGSSYEFDARGLLTRHVDRNDNATQFKYDDEQLNPSEKTERLTSIIDTYGLETKYKYDDDGYLDVITDFAGRETDFLITGGGLTQVVEPASDEEGSEQTVYTFGYSGRNEIAHLDLIVDGRDTRTQIYYDGADRVNEVLNGDGYAWGFGAELVDGLDIFNGLAGRLHLASSEGQLSAAQWLDESPEEAGLREAGAIYSDPRENWWFYQTDKFGLKLTESNPEPFGDLWNWERNTHGLVTKATQPKGGGGSQGNLSEIVTEFDYDEFGNLISLQTDQPENANSSSKISESWNYDSEFSVLTSYTDGNEHTTTYTIDDRGNVTGINAPEGVSTSFTYTAAASSQEPEDPSASLPGGLILTMTDPRGFITSTEYYDKSDSDSAIEHGLVKKVTAAQGTPDESIVHYEYDEHRNQTFVHQQMDEDDVNSGPEDAPDRTIE